MRRRLERKAARGCEQWWPRRRCKCWRATWSRELIGRAAGAALWSAGECPGWTFQSVMTGHQGQGRIRPPPSRHRGEVDMAYQPWRRAEKLCTGVKEMNSLNGPGWRSHLRQAHNLPTSAIDQSDVMRWRGPEVPPNIDHVWHFQHTIRRCRFCPLR